MSYCWTHRVVGLPMKRRDRVVSRRCPKSPAAPRRRCEMEERPSFPYCRSSVHLAGMSGGETEDDNRDEFDPALVDSTTTTTMTQDKRLT